MKLGKQNAIRYRPVLAAVILTLAMVRPASAYVDPGSGALLWQMLVAGLIGGLFYVRRIGRWIVSFFQESRRTDSVEEN